MNIEADIEHIASERYSAIEEIGFFDASIWIGKPKGFPVAEALEPGGIRPIMERYRLKGGLVSNWDAVTLSPQDSNQILLDIEKHLPENVYTIWTGLPLLPREQDHVPGFDKPPPKCRGVRLFPKSHKFVLSPWVIGGLCEWCIRYNLPLFFWHVEIEWEWVYALSKEYPGLRIIVDTQWQKILYHMRTLYGLLEACPNILVDTSNFFGQDFISHGVKTFGAERFIYGSFLPVNDPFAGIGMLFDADISLEEKKLIGGENIQRIVKGAEA
jgi:hypothetical protein